MKETTKIEIVRPGGRRTLAQVLDDMSRNARAAGLTDADVDAELAAYNAERRHR